MLLWTDTTCCNVDSISGGERNFDQCIGSVPIQYGNKCRQIQNFNHDYCLDSHLSGEKCRTDDTSPHILIGSSFTSLWQADIRSAIGRQILSLKDCCSCYLHLSDIKNVELMNYDTKYGNRAVVYELLIASYLCKLKSPPAAQILHFISLSFISF